MALVVAVVLGLLSSSSCSAAAVTMAITAVAVVATTVAVAKQKSIQLKKDGSYRAVFLLDKYENK